MKRFFRRRRARATRSKSNGSSSTASDDAPLDPLPVVLRVPGWDSVSSIGGDNAIGGQLVDLEGLLKIIDDDEPAESANSDDLAASTKSERSLKLSTDQSVSSDTNESIVTLPTKNAQSRREKGIVTSLIYLSLLPSLQDDKGASPSVGTSPREVVLTSLSAYLRMHVSEENISNTNSNLPVSKSGITLLKKDDWTRLSDVDKMVQRALVRKHYNRVCKKYENLRRDIMVRKPKSEIVRPLLSRLALTCLMAGYKKKAKAYCRKFIEYSDSNVTETTEALILRGFLCFGFDQLEIAFTSWREAAYKVSSDSAYAALLWNNVACLQVQMGSVEEARDSLDQSIALQNQVQNDASDATQAMLDIATTKSNFAAIEMTQKDYASAGDRLAESLLLQESILSDTNNTVQNTKLNLQRVRTLDQSTPPEDRIPRRPSTVLDQWKQPLFGESGGISLPRATSDVGATADFIQLGPLMNEFSPHERIQESFSEAFDFLKQATAISDTRSKRSRLPVDVDSSQIMHADTKLPGLYQDVTDHLTRNEVNEALELLKACLQNHRDKYGMFHPLVASTLHNIGIVLLFANRYDDALRYFHQAVSIRINALGINHAEVCSSMMKLALIQVARREFDNALAAFSQVLYSRRKSLGYDNPQIAMALNNIAIVHMHCGGLVAACKSLEEALEVLRKSGAKNSKALLAMSILLSNQGFVLCKRGLYEESTAAYLEASEIQKSLYPANHAGLAMTIENLGFVMTKSRQNRQSDTSFLDIMQCSESTAAEIHKCANPPTFVMSNTQQNRKGDTSFLDVMQCSGPFYQ